MGFFSKTFTEKAIKAGAKELGAISKTANSLRAGVKGAANEADLITKISNLETGMHDKVAEGMKAAVEQGIIRDFKPKGWVQRHKVLTGVGLATGAVVAHNMLSGDGSAPEVDYQQGQMAAMNDIAASMNAMPTAMAGNIDYQGRVAAPQRAVGV